MTVTPKSLQSEMRRSFASVLLRIEQKFTPIDKLQNKLSDRIETLLLRFAAHAKETDLHFRESGYAFAGTERRMQEMLERLAGVDQSFEEVRRNFDELHMRFEQKSQDLERSELASEALDLRFVKLKEELVDALAPNFTNLEKMLVNYKRRLPSPENDTAL